MGGDCFWGDLLEREAFNAFPATTTADMWAHQYDQMTNQISAQELPDGSVPFNSNSGEANMFGLEPNFGCCTANFNQAWPKFALSGVMSGGDGLVVQSLVPVTASVVIKDTPVRVAVRSEYPFRDEAVIEVTAEHPVEFSLEIRIPGFAKAASVDQEAVGTGAYYTLRRRWENTSTVSVKLKFRAELTDRPGDMKVLVRGPLVFSLPIRAKVRRLEYIRDGVERKYPYCDYEMLPDSPWNYAFCSEDFRVIHEGIGDYPFSTEHPPIRLETQMVPVPWSENSGICAAFPDSLTPVGKPQTVLLQPYGCTNLRMTEMPWCGASSLN